MSSSSSPPSKICFNPDCRETKSDRWRKGWRLRAGGLADLCDRCASAYEEVRFCEAFHSEAAGWRNCESCGKRVHCGCIASTHAFTLLDAGGVECMACTRKSFIMASNQIWPPSLSPSLSLPERLKDISAKSWSRITGSSSGPGHWWQAPYVWNSAASRTELHPRMPCEVDRLNAIDKLISGEHPSISNLENKKISDLPERITSGSFKLAASDRVANGNLGVDSLASLNTFRNEGNIDGLQDAVRLTGENDPTDLRKGVLTEAGLNGSLTVKNFETQSNSCQNISLQSALKDDPLNPLVSSSVPFSSPNEANNPMRVSGTQSQRQTPPSLGKKFFTNSQNGLDISGELQTQVRNRSRGEGQRRNQVLPRYWPRVTDQELQQMSGDSNSVITPLFEKMLSASDAGRIGRLVLPKKCAEAYFPTISQPEGLPLQVQDAKGKEWMFQFRFWPNNNSRMYVLEGVTPCIQSMQLQAGDTVTFSRIDPEGKLVMGFRKASSVQSEQDTQAFKSGNGSSTNGEVNSKVSKTGDPASVHTLHPCKGGAESTNQALMNQVNPADPKHASSRVDKSGGIPKEGPGAKASISKRKGSSLGSKNKRLRITNEDSLDLKLTWEEAQELLRPPPNRVPSIVVIEGHEFEEYEEAPVFGMPTIFTTSYAGEKNQWVQCEDCLKWRKLPMDVLLPSKWICSDNVWDPKRSSCSSVQEITTEQLDFLLSSKTASKRTKVKEEKDTVEASDGLDTLANLAILGEDEVNLSQPTTKHPRHRPGCTCIVCIQPPSGKGPKHKPTCTCNVCLTVKRRFRTLMLRREKRQSEKEAETAQKPSEKPSIEAEEPAYIKANDSSPNMKPVSSEGFSVDPNRRTPLSSPLKGHIDLNIQPEREEELSPTSDSGNLVLPHQDGMEPYPNSENLVGNRAMTVDQSDTSGSVKVQRLDSGPNNSIQLDAELSRLAAMALSVSASTSATG